MSEFRHPNPERERPEMYRYEALRFLLKITNHVKSEDEGRVELPEDLLQDFDKLRRLTDAPSELRELPQEEALSRFLLLMKGSVTERYDKK
jgi:hypothetical protein